MRKNTGEPCRGPAAAQQAPGPAQAGAAATDSQATAEAIQLAIGLLTASLDSPQLQAQAMEI
jgi:hypothetical protein